MGADTMITLGMLKKVNAIIEIADENNKNEDNDILCDIYNIARSLREDLNHVNRANNVLKQYVLSEASFCHTLEARKP
jgi:hypothetical protein